MLLANRSKQAEFRGTAKHMAGDIWASRSVADVLRQFFFTSIRACETGFDDYLGHGRYFTLKPNVLRTGQIL